MGAGLATAMLVGGVFVGSAATAQTGAEDTSTQGSARVKNLDAPRERPAFSPQGVVVDGSVARVSGKNRYDTAAVIAREFGWSFENTGGVYIASGANYADALAMGPSMLGDGPLLLVNPTAIPKETATVLDELQPCYIYLIGGSGAINDTVMKGLKKHTYPKWCEELP